MKIFHSAYLKLTLFYVAIVMVISISFSYSIYRIASYELNTGLGRQARVLHDMPIIGIPADQLPDFDQIRLDQLEASNSSLRLNLLYFNLLILLLSSGASYFLAKRTLKPIKDAMEAQNHFTADASHELRTPLTAMRTEIEVSLRDQKLALPQTKALLQSNLEEIEKLESLSASLLKLARSQDETRQSFGEVALEDVVTESYEKVAAMAEKKQIEISPHLINLRIEGDKQSLIEVFVILLDNAVKYSPEKSKIAIFMERETLRAIHPLWAKVVIKDHGVGIKASDMPFVFNRFYRADTSRSKEKVDGYGLGLSIAKQIVDLHGGKISVKSHLGKGSEFIVRFPLLKS